MGFVNDLMDGAGKVERYKNSKVTLHCSNAEVKFQRRETCELTGALLFPDDIINATRVNVKFKATILNNTNYIEYYDNLKLVVSTYNEKFAYNNFWIGRKELSSITVNPKESFEAELSISIRDLDVIEKMKQQYVLDFKITNIRTGKSLEEHLCNS